MNTTDLVNKVNEQINDVVKISQEQATKAVGDWTETIEGFLPETISDLDVIENLPKPAELVELAFEFTQKVLEYQAELARSIAGLVDGFLPGEEAAPKAATTTAKKTAKASA